MNYSGLIKNDFSAAPGVSVTLFVSGCDAHCPGCHNPEAQDFNYGTRFTEQTIDEIIEALSNNNIKRNLCIMGGEPMHPNNTFEVWSLIDEVLRVLPKTQIYIWTGYIYEDLVNRYDKTTDAILFKTNYLIDGPYIEAERDVRAHMRGSRNQRIIHLTFGQINSIIK